MREKLSFLLIPLLVKCLLTLITMTCRVKWHGRERLQALQDSDKAWITSLWHDNVSITTWALRNRDITVMVSDSADGEIISRCVKKFGNDTVRGSSSSGSSKATRGVLKLLKKGKPIAITPDGPRGPKYKAQAGVLWLAALGKVPVLPFHIEASAQWVLNSWDNHKVPKPFSTIHISVGEPYSVDRDKLNETPGAVIAEFEELMMGNANLAKRKASAVKSV